MGTGARLVCRSDIAGFYTLPPQVPEQRLRTLQNAFVSTLKDSQFLAEVEKAKLEIDPIHGPGIEKMVNGLYEIEPAVVSSVKQILEAKEDDC